VIKVDDTKDWRKKMSNGKNDMLDHNDRPISPNIKLPNSGCVLLDVRYVKSRDSYVVRYAQKPGDFPEVEYDTGLKLPIQDPNKLVVEKVDLVPEQLEIVLRYIEKHGMTPEQWSEFQSIDRGYPASTKEVAVYDFLRSEFMQALRRASNPYDKTENETDGLECKFEDDDFEFPPPQNSSGVLK
jgi:hypothetical protein